MQNRIETNGSYVSEEQPLPGSASSPNPVVAGVEAATSHVADRFSELVKSSPGKSLLVALAAGIAVGIWMKRS